MELAMRLPVSLAGALMADAHAGYGLPIGGVLAVDNAVIPYAVGVDIGCRMALSVFDETPAFLSRYAFQIKQALGEKTHFGMEGGLPFAQEHEVLERPEFQVDDFLKTLHGKAVRQLGSSGSGNHFVELGELELFDKNCFGLPAGKYTALLSHSGSRGLGAEIARRYSDIAREQCRLPREAGHFAWLDMASEAGQAYWISMNLAGDYAKACHSRIHLNMAKALGLKICGTISNHHNFAWKETLADGREAIVHRKGATPAHSGEPGIIPGSMTTPGYLVQGCGVPESLYSASHGAGRAMSRQKAKETFTLSALKKMLSGAGVQLIGGSVEEAPSAYKDIEQVMDFQKELVTVQGKFMPRIVRMNKE
jgi:tRNA-splicing ligase RtcB